MIPSFRHLRHLTALAEYRHFGRAAAACHVSQSTLSASIKELERVLEASLVDRSKRRVVFTPLGNETVERAQKIIDLVEELAEATQSRRDPLSGTLRMGSIPTIGPYLLPRVLPGLRRAYGRLKLYLVEDLTARLIEGLHQAGWIANRNQQRHIANLARPAAVSYPLNRWRRHPRHPACRDPDGA